MKDTRAGSRLSEVNVPTTSPTGPSPTVLPVTTETPVG